MARKAELFEAAGASPLEGYFLVKAQGANITRAFSERTAISRRNRHEKVAEALRGGNWGDIVTLRDWEEIYLKECFYYGIRILLELERQGKTGIHKRRQPRYGGPLHDRPRRATADPRAYPPTGNTRVRNRGQTRPAYRAR